MATSLEVIESIRFVTQVQEQIAGTNLLVSEDQTIKYGVHLCERHFYLTREQLVKTVKLISVFWNGSENPDCLSDRRGRTTNRLLTGLVDGDTTHFSSISVDKSLETGSAIAEHSRLVMCRRLAMVARDVSELITNRSFTIIIAYYSKVTVMSPMNMLVEQCMWGPDTTWPMLCRNNSINITQIYVKAETKK